MSSEHERRAELRRAYKERPPPAGVLAVRNRVSGKLAVAASPNLPGALNRLRFELASRIHRTWPELQQDWLRLGPEAFSFEVLDELRPPEDPAVVVDLREELQALEALWLERLQPYGEAGYHTRPPL